MKSIPMNEEILNVINAVVSYGKFVRDHNYIIPKEDFDPYEEMEKYYHSLPLPDGMKKNRFDFERILQIGWYSDEELKRLNNLEFSELSSVGWKYDWGKYDWDEGTKSVEPCRSVDEKLLDASERSAESGRGAVDSREYVKE